ncbi:D-alanyl-lipoteichoic acid acyltransferase DltB, MBOAT superfamily [Rugamonas rubra]|uniref:Probable alginate O-acetylase AlgI n=2 Tax=Rugamonas rubra TaxID=758825 RepID=A0A1I4KZ38_9BURK|nr:D-alanyl-lipoteichoic acid acyltransferase DltB, MBOAT superfamily [Rugamonas rubra]
MGRKISDLHAAGDLLSAKRWLIVGLVANLSLLVFFKYFDFLLGNFSLLIGRPYQQLGLALPIGISFFTFTQIAYLVDCNAGKVRETKPESYGLFVTYFPHLIAGPILHHKEMMPQFDQPDSHVFSRGRLILGLLFFTSGLFKKVVLADGVARYVGPVFDVSQGNLTMLEGWAGALSYTFQLYFDFSAYSDMAYGLSYMFGIVLPINFNSPYQSRSIIEFWRRWHITLSTFLRDYLYIPLGGNRDGDARRYLNLVITMLLGGLWHGANWTFVIWGGLHGFYLVCNHGLRHLLAGRDNWCIRVLGTLLTLLAVVVGWVFFRANSVASACAILKAMAGGTMLSVSGASLGINRIMDVNNCLVWLAACAAITFLMPNIYQVLGTGLRREQERRLEQGLGGMLLGALLLLSALLLAISETRGVSEFLYFNF